MKASFKSIFDAVVTSTFGLVIFTVTTTLWISGKINLEWTGLIGYAAAVILIICPKSVETWVGDVIKSKFGGKDSVTPPNPPREI